MLNTTVFHIHCFLHSKIIKLVYIKECDCVGCDAVQCGVISYTAWCHFPGKGNLHSHCIGNLMSH